jgi:hypothetical protein
LGHLTDNADFVLQIDAVTLFDRVPNMVDQRFDVRRRRVAGIDDEIGVFR